MPEAELRADFGIVGDAHAGSGLRQVSLLAMESIEELRAKGADISPGDFAENITVEGLDLSALAVGRRLRIGGDVETGSDATGQTLSRAVPDLREGGRLHHAEAGGFRPRRRRRTNQGRGQ